MMPPKHRPTNPVFCGPEGVGLAVCAVMLVCGLRMKETGKTADAAPDRPAGWRRPQQSHRIRADRPDGVMDSKLLARVPLARIGEFLVWAMADAASAAAWASKDAAGAMDWAKKSISDESLRHSVLAAEMVAWSKTAPRFPDGSLRAAAIENLVSQWRQIDPVTAQQWRPKNL